MENVESRVERSRRLFVEAIKEWFFPAWGFGENNSIAFKEISQLRTESQRALAEAFKSSATTISDSCSLVKEFLEISSYIGVLLVFKGGFYDAPLSSDLDVDKLKEYLRRHEFDDIFGKWNSFIKQGSGKFLNDKDFGKFLIADPTSQTTIDFVRKHLEEHQYDFYRKAVDFIYKGKHL